MRTALGLLISEQTRRRSVGTMLPRAGPRGSTSTGRSISDLLVGEWNRSRLPPKGWCVRATELSWNLVRGTRQDCHYTVLATKHLWRLSTPIINQPKILVNPSIYSKAGVWQCIQLGYNHMQYMTRLCLASSFPCLDVLPSQTFQAYVQPHTSTTTTLCGETIRYTTCNTHNTLVNITTWCNALDLSCWLYVVCIINIRKIKQRNGFFFYTQRASAVTQNRFNDSLGKHPLFGAIRFTPFPIPIALPSSFSSFLSAPRRGRPWEGAFWKSTLDKRPTTASNLLSPWCLGIPVWDSDGARCSEFITKLRVLVI